MKVLNVHVALQAYMIIHSLFSVFWMKIRFFKNMGIVPFGDQFWALSSIIQCTAIQPNFPGKIYLYTVATYSQHYKTLNIFTSRVVFAILWPIFVALSRHQFWAVVTQ